MKEQVVCLCYFPFNNICVFFLLISDLKSTNKIYRDNFTKIYSLMNWYREEIKCAADLLCGSAK